LVQKLYLALSLSARQRIAQRARLQSMRSHANKSMQVMDVNPDAIVQAFSKTDVPALIHGHTHRPGHHHELIAGKPHDRWVLTDWAFDHLPEGSPVRGGGLMVDASGVHVIDWAGQKIK
jgi:UDP-2,3-diacylglucosamine hydrolase